MSLKLNNVYHGFKLFEEKYVKEINSQTRLFLHEKTGARLLQIENEDPNKVFSISFRTPPYDSTGLPHILEHSVLCGSKKFPLKDPFVQLAKGSLNTFLNAMTFPDKTMYPIASVNDKDFINLMDVYLDAVFHPRIYQAKEILMQEGWHYDIDNKNSELEYKGVVYNEMKGALSSPESVLFQKNMESLFPDTPYKYESGGDPDVIPDLTQEEFINFHKKYYHPSNSFIFLYGNLNVEEVLNFIDTSYLDEYSTLEVDSKIPLQRPFENRQIHESEYSILPDEEETDKTYFSLNYVVSNATNAEQYLAFEILEYLLLETPAAPLKKALLEAELGSDVFGVFDNSILQPTLSVVLKNTNPEVQERFVGIVESTLQKLVADGIDKALIEAAINRKEFDLREADYHGFSKGLLYAIKCMDSWLYGAKPTLHLEYEDSLQRIKTALTSNYFESLINDCILKNKHSSLVVLKPKRGLAEEKAAEVRQELAERKAKLSDSELDNLIKQTLELREIQQTPDSPEDLEKIPMLALQDIDKKAQNYPVQEKKVDNVTTLAYSDFTNQIAYINILFDTSTVDQDLLPYIGLLGSVLAKIDTQKYSYEELANQINIHTGGIGFNAEMFLQNGIAEQYQPKFVVKSKALVSKTEQLMELLSEILVNTRFDNKNRLKEIIQETKSRLEMAMYDQGHTIAKNRVLSYFSPRMKYLEMVNGISYYKMLANLAKDFNNKYEEIKANLEKVKNSIFNKNTALISVTTEEKDYPAIEAKLGNFIKCLAHENIQHRNYELDLTPANEGLLTPGKVQYVAKAYNFIKLGREYSGAMQVLKTVLSLDYLWNKVRVQGGAYGSFAGFDRNGDMFFVSYRDPNLKETLETYNHVVEYLQDFNISEREMTKYIIGTISKLDFPLTPAGKGERAAAYYISNITAEDLQKERQEVLETKQEKLREFADLFKEAMNKNYYCVFGSEGKIKQNQDLFKEIITVFE